MEAEIRRAAKVDSNHGKIVQAFRELGCSVLDLSAVGCGCPDILVGSRLHGTFLAEIKDGQLAPSRKALNPLQVAFHENWRGKVFVVESVQDVIKCLTSLKG